MALSDGAHTYTGQPSQLRWYTEGITEPPKIFPTLPSAGELRLIMRRLHSLAYHVHGNWTRTSLLIGLEM